MPKAGGGGGRGAGGGGRAARARGGGGGLSPKDRLEQMGVSPNMYLNDMDPAVAAQLSKMLPPGTVYIGGGAEAFALRLPDGTVVRVQVGGPYDRPNIGIVLQPTKSKVIVGPGGVKTYVDRMPFVTSARTMSYAEQQRGREYIRTQIPKGYYDNDLHSDNFGKTSSGHWTVFDPGGVQKFGSNPAREINIPHERRGGI